MCAFPSQKEGLPADLVNQDASMSISNRRLPAQTAEDREPTHARHPAHQLTFAQCAEISVQEDALLGLLPRLSPPLPLGPCIDRGTCLCVPCSSGASVYQSCRPQTQNRLQDKKEKGDSNNSSSGSAAAQRNATRSVHNWPKAKVPSSLTTEVWRMPRQSANRDRSSSRTNDAGLMHCGNEKRCVSPV